MTSDDLLVTCEHGGNQVPAAYRRLFAGRAAREALRSHRGWDPGAREVARAFARRTGAPLHEARTTRLLVELNRSLHHPRLFSEFCAPLSRIEREAVLARIYRPYRDGVEQAVRRQIAAGRRVLHLSVHSFTGIWQGEVRDLDIGLLYDPARSLERQVCAEWQARLRVSAPGLRVRRNRPYRGVSDGLVTYLRHRFSRFRYAGIELEVNNSLVASVGGTRQHTIDAVVASLQQALR